MRYEPADQSQQALMLVALQKLDDAFILGSAAVEPLIIALKDSTSGWEVRRDIAIALGAIGDGHAVEVLIVALKDSYRDLRRAAAEALVRIGSAADAIELLADLRDLDSRAKGGDFEMRVEALRQAHARKPALIERLKKAGL